MYECSELLIVDGYQYKYIPTFLAEISFYFRNDMTFYSYV